MATYVILANFTEQGITNIKDTVDRGEKFKALVGQLGGSVNTLLWTMGRYDIVSVIEAPSDEVASAIVLKVSMLGNVRGETLRAFTADDVTGIIGQLG
jgi:uncharacterized protein with GYD domain